MEALLRCPTHDAHPVLSVYRQWRVSLLIFYFVLSPLLSLRSQQPSSHKDKIQPSEKTLKKKEKKKGRKQAEDLQETVLKLTVVLALRPDQEHGCTEQQRQPQIHKAEHV